MSLESCFAKKKGIIMRQKMSWFTSWQPLFFLCLLPFPCVCLILLSPPPLSVFVHGRGYSLWQVVPGESLPTNQPLHKASGSPVTHRQIILSAERYSVRSWLLVKPLSLVCLTCVASLTCCFLCHSWVHCFACLSACLLASLPTCLPAPLAAGHSYPSIFGAFDQHADWWMRGSAITGEDAKQNV